MKNIINLLIIIVFVSLFTNCEKDNDTLNVKIINHTNVDIDTITLYLVDIYNNDYISDSTEIIKTINAGSMLNIAWSDFSHSNGTTYEFSIKLKDFKLERYFGGIENGSFDCSNAELFILGDTIYVTHDW